MTKTPTLRVSTGLLDLEAAPPLLGPSQGVPEREVPLRLRTALTLDKPRTGRGSGPDQSSLDKPRIGRGSGPDLSQVPKNQKHVRRPWWPLPSESGSSGSVRFVLTF